MSRTEQREVTAGVGQASDNPSQVIDVGSANRHTPGVCASRVSGRKPASVGCIRKRLILTSASTPVVRTHTSAARRSQPRSRPAPGAAGLYSEQARGSSFPSAKEHAPSPAMINGALTNTGGPSSHVEGRLPPSSFPTHRQEPSTGTTGQEITPGDPRPPWRPRHRHRDALQGYKPVIRQKGTMSVPPPPTS